MSDSKFASDEQFVKELIAENARLRAELKAYEDFRKSIDKHEEFAFGQCGACKKIDFYSEAIVDNPMNYCSACNSYYHDECLRACVECLECANCHLELGESFECNDCKNVVQPIGTFSIPIVDPDM